MHGKDKRDWSCKRICHGRIDGMKKIAIVMFDTITSNVCCTSNTFEFRGHICWHIFVVFQNKGFRKTWTIHFSWVEKNVREKVMIYEWDEKLFENSIKAHRSNDLYSLFLKISEMCYNAMRPTRRLYWRTCHKILAIWKNNFMECIG